MSKEDPTSQLISFTRKGISFERLIRFFFASNAGLTIVIVGLIIVFLAKEGLGFFPGYQREREIYRITGMEYVDLSREVLSNHESLVSMLNRSYFAEINGQAKNELDRSTQGSNLASQMDEVTIAVRDQYFENIEGENVSADLIAQLKSRYKALLPLSEKSLIPTPALSAEERKQIIDFMLSREIDNEESPELVDKLVAEYASAQQKFRAPLEPIRLKIDGIEAAASDLSSLVMDITDRVKESKAVLDEADILARDRDTLLQAAKSAKTKEERDRLLSDVDHSDSNPPDVTANLENLLSSREEHIAILEKLDQFFSKLSLSELSSYQEEEAVKLSRTAQRMLDLHMQFLKAAPEKLKEWDASKPVGLGSTIVSFLTGKRWITGGEWQDFYGILPLFIGSFMIAIVALLLSIPLGVGSAIYVNQFASSREQNIVKPIIEFIQAIPSVVLGFIGIFVLGNALRELSDVTFLSWVPGFPMDERLNIFTAGCLLALMAIPTIFSLSEDAINNIPSAYSEASEALGASKLQTTFRVIVPAAFSGILAAVLLGLGRVIGETMVVLLVAGNRIMIPDFSAGIGAFFQPAHTMTGIIAQELGEVPMGSVHYRALFIVGVLLFFIVLGINALSHHISHKLRRS